MENKSKKERFLEYLLTWGLVIIIVALFALMIVNSADSAPSLDNPYPPPYPEPIFNPYPGPFLPVLFGEAGHENP